MGETVPEPRENTPEEDREMILLFLGMAAKKSFAPVMWLSAEVHRQEEKDGPPPKRWPSFVITCPTKIRRRDRIVANLFLWTLYSLAVRSVEGGMHLTMHYRYGRRQPQERLVRDVIRLLRESGLKVSLRKRPSGSVSVFISFRDAFGDP